MAHVRNQFHHTYNKVRGYCIIRLVKPHRIVTVFLVGIIHIMKKLTTFQLNQLDKHVYKREGASLLEPYLQVSPDNHSIRS